jgi:hypothetical protein
MDFGFMGIVFLGAIEYWADSPPLQVGCDFRLSGSVRRRRDLSLQMILVVTSTRGRPPNNLCDNPTGEALEDIVDLDLDALAAIVPPRMPAGPSIDWGS